MRCLGQGLELRIQGFGLLDCLRAVPFRCCVGVGIALLELLFGVVEGLRRTTGRNHQHERVGTCSMSAKIDQQHSEDIRNRSMKEFSHTSMNGKRLRLASENPPNPCQAQNLINP